MKTFEKFLDECKRRTNSTSDSQMAHKIGISRQLLNKHRIGASFPKEEVIIALAKRADFDPDTALLWLCIWRSKEPAKRHYTAILKRLSAVLLVSIVYIMSTSPQGSKFEINQTLTAISDVSSVQEKYKLCAILLNITNSLVSDFLNSCVEPPPGFTGGCLV